MTLTEYFDDWLEGQRLRLQPVTLDAYRQTLACYVTPTLGTTALEALTPGQLELLYANLLDHGGRNGRPLALRTIRYVHAILRKALGDGVRTGVIAVNIGDRVALPRHHPRRHALEPFQVWTAEQMRTFLTLTCNDPHRDLWAVALGTGMRRGELLGLRWRDVAPDQRQLRVAVSLTMIDGRPRLKTTRTNRVRSIHIDAHTAAAIRRQRRRTTRNDLELVFTDTAGHPLIPQRITHRFRRLARRLPLPTIRLHDLRHTHATLLLQAGVPVKVVSERLGHATIATTLDTYAHVLPATDRDAADRFADLHR